MVLVTASAQLSMDLTMMHSIVSSSHGELRLLHVFVMIHPVSYTNTIPLLRTRQPTFPGLTLFKPFFTPLSLLLTLCKTFRGHFDLLAYQNLHRFVIGTSRGRHHR